MCGCGCACIMLSLRKRAGVARNIRDEKREKTKTYMTPEKIIPKVGGRACECMWVRAREGMLCMRVCVRVVVV